MEHGELVAKLSFATLTSYRKQEIWDRNKE